MTKLYTYICVACGGDNIINEQPSRWDTNEQDWITDYEVMSRGDSWCEDCGDYHEIKRVEWHPVLPEEVTK
jgi:hypothetical protein